MGTTVNTEIMHVGEILALLTGTLLEHVVLPTLGTFVCVGIAYHVLTTVLAIQRKRSIHANVQLVSTDQTAKIPLAIQVRAQMEHVPMPEQILRARV